MTEKRVSLKSNIIFVSAIAVFCTLLWGSAFPCIKIGYNLFHISGSDTPSVLIFAGARFSLAGIIVFIIGLFLNAKSMIPKKRDLLPVSALAFFQTFLQYLLLYTGLVTVSGTKSSIFTSVAAFGSVILSAIVFRSDRFTAKKALGCLIGISGVVIMNLSGDLGGFMFPGDLLVILSNLSENINRPKSLLYFGVAAYHRRQRTDNLRSCFRRKACFLRYRLCTDSFISCGYGGSCLYALDNASFSQ